LQRRGEDREALARTGRRLAQRGPVPADLTGEQHRHLLLSGAALHRAVCGGLRKSVRADNPIRAVQPSRNPQTGNRPAAAYRLKPAAGRGRAGQGFDDDRRDLGVVGRVVPMQAVTLGADRLGGSKSLSSTTRVAGKQMITVERCSAWADGWGFESGAACHDGILNCR
jgi:hypothetical protein